MRHPIESPAFRRAATSGRYRRPATHGTVQAEAPSSSAALPGPPRHREGDAPPGSRGPRRRQTAAVEVKIKVEVEVELQRNQRARLLGILEMYSQLTESPDAPRAAVPDITGSPGRRGPRRAAARGARLERPCLTLRSLEVIIEQRESRPPPRGNRDRVTTSGALIGVGRRSRSSVGPLRYAPYARGSCSRSPWWASAWRGGLRRRTGVSIRNLYPAALAAPVLAIAAALAPLASCLVPRSVAS
jgi:hypothetical protein